MQAIIRADLSHDGDEIAHEVGVQRVQLGLMRDGDEGDAAGLRRRADLGADPPAISGAPRSRRSGRSRGRWWRGLPGDHILDLLKPLGASSQTTSTTRSGPPLRLLATSAAVLGSRSACIGGERRRHVRPPAGPPGSGHRAPPGRRRWSRPDTSDAPRRPAGSPAPWSTRAADRGRTSDIPAAAAEARISASRSRKGSFSRRASGSTSASRPRRDQSSRRGGGASPVATLA